MTHHADSKRGKGTNPSLFDLSFRYCTDTHLIKGVVAQSPIPSIVMFPFPPPPVLSSSLSLLVLRWSSVSLSEESSATRSFGVGSVWEGFPSSALRSVSFVIVLPPFCCLYTFGIALLHPASFRLSLSHSRSSSSFNGGSPPGPFFTCSEKALFLSRAAALFCISSRFRAGTAGGLTAETADNRPEPNEANAIGACDVRAGEGGLGLLAAGTGGRAEGSCLGEDGVVCCWEVAFVGSDFLMVPPLEEEAGELLVLFMLSMTPEPLRAAPRRERVSLLNLALGTEDHEVCAEPSPLDLSLDLVSVLVLIAFAAGRLSSVQWDIMNSTAVVERGMSAIIWAESCIWG